MGFRTIFAFLLTLSGLGLVLEARATTCNPREILRRSQGPLVRPIQGEAYGKLDGFPVFQAGKVVLTLKGRATAEVWRLTPTQFRSLPKGTVLVDARTHQTLMIGVHFFDRTLDADGFLEYGLSSRIEAQPFLEHPVFKDYDAVTLYDAIELPQVAREYLTLNGGEADGLQTTVVREEDSEAIIAKIVIVGFDRSEAGIAAMRELGRAAGVPKRSLPTVEPILTLKNSDQYEAYFTHKMQEAGGRDALIKRYNQKADPIDSLYWHSPGFERRIRAFFEKHRLF